MAITQEQVYTAADAIAANGKTATVAAVRANQGTGSFSTITPILSEWTEAQAPRPCGGRTPPIKPLRFSCGNRGVSNVGGVWRDAFR
jgi:hypothetical protein